MNIGDVTALVGGAVWQILILSAPILLTALVVGLVIAVIQATTSIQEQTLSFVPKIAAIMLVLALLAGWMFSTLGEYTVNLFSRISGITG
ncbi:MAG: flagellar biosynthesis protein FliQ [Spirochaetales bacterium]|nr:flagellar biosynthesis protein FliQ [Spirochaetales bacterium]MBP7262723.1 flagellar biosynthesis protein FliQ [Spirochaetia bacterium]